MDARTGSKVGRARGDRLGALRSALPIAVVGALVVACSSASSESGEGGGGKASGNGDCGAFCEKLQAGLGCSSVSVIDCVTECEDLSKTCPEQAGPMLQCLAGLAIECTAPGYAIAHSRDGSTGKEKELVGKSATLDVQDPICAELVDAFGDCKPPAQGCAAVTCSAPSVADCALATCVTAVAGESTDEACGNGVDDDGNGYVDCADFHCSANPAVTVCGTREVTDETCSNGVDDDGNGYVDCADITCQISPSVTVCPAEKGPGACANGTDDDGDGAVDCADVSCKGSPFVGCP